MQTATRVAQYILQKRRGNAPGDVQLQKWLYYAQAWSLVWTGEPLFRSRIEAWKMGPVVAEVYRHEGQITPTDEGMTTSTSAILDAVLDHYGKYYGTQLISMTHSEDPWARVWEAHAINDRCSHRISEESMRKYYTSVALRGEGPTRPKLARVNVTDEEVLASVRRNRGRWTRTLEILGA